MYLDFYKLKLKPFQITVDPKFLWLGEKHKEALATLRYGIVDNRGFLLLTGEVGTGKTILINRLITLLDIDTVVATLPDPDLDSMDFYNLLADGLKMRRTFSSKGAFLIHLRDFLHQSYADQKQVLLIIDESQRLNHKLMEDIRVLSNIELHDRKLINIFFVGQQEFNSILMTPQNRALTQRITVRYHIEPLDKVETGEYVSHRLKIAGRTKPLFSKSAHDEIFLFSGGIPRLVNIISDHALLTGYSRELKRIDGATIKECAEELRIPIQAPAMETVAIKPVDAPEPKAPVGPKANERALEPGQGGAGSVPDRQQSPPPDTHDSPLIWKLGYLVLVLGLIAAVAYIITQFSNGQTNRYDVADLTPQKYMNTLEKEKAFLADRLDRQANGMTKEERVLEDETDDIAADASTTDNGPRPTPEVDANSVAADSNRFQVIDTRETEGPADGVATSHEGQRPAEKAIGEAVHTIAGPGGVEQTPEIFLPKIEPLPLKDEKIIIPFGNNSNEIDARFYAVLDQVATYLAQNPQKFLHIRGYTDTSGSSGYNQSVSRFRASAVKSYLIGKGADPEKMEVIAMGDKNPIAPNDNMEGRGKNRRVEIEFADRKTVGD